MTVLKFSLSPEAVAKLHDMLACLAKFSDTVSLEARKEYLSISALNPSKSGYAAFALNRKFFEVFKYVSDVNGREGKFTCSILNKALISVFKGRINDMRNRDTAISRCDVSVQDSDDRVECRLVIKMICAHGVTKVYELTYEATEVVHALFDRNTANNRWTTNALFLKEFSEHFGPKAEQLDIYLEDDKVTFLSFTDKIVNSKNEILKAPLKTVVAVSTADFDDFDAKEKLHIVISVKDFKSIVSHAAITNANISAYYSNPGRPLQFTYTEGGMTSNFTLMTAGDYGDTPAPSADTSAAPTRHASRAPSMAASAAEETRRQAERSIDMPPPAVPNARRTGRKLGQNDKSKQQKEEQNPLFVPGEDDTRWDPPDYENEEEESMGWDASFQPDAGFQPTFRDTQSLSRSHSTEQPIEGLPPTQRISQIKGLW